MSMPSPSFELHRTGWMRFGGGPILQPALVVFAGLWLIFAIYNDQLVLLILPAVALVLWLAGATAYVRVDNSGIHHRCYLSRTDLWSDIRWVELRTVVVGTNNARRMIRVHRTRGRHWLAPAAGNGKHTEQFARKLLAAAQNRGIKVTASGWGGFEE